MPIDSQIDNPTIDNFSRGLNVQTIKAFRGINVFQGQAQLGPEWALDCMNVLVPGWGGLSKFRLPVAMSAAIAARPVMQSFWEFQQGNGTRQVVANLDNSLYYFTWNAAGIALSAATLIETAVNDSPQWSMVEANNILFGANSQRMMKWTGASWWRWGIDAPPANPITLNNAPTLGGLFTISNISRAAGVVTVIVNLPPEVPALFVQTGDIVTIQGVVTDPTVNGTFSAIALGANSFRYNSAGGNFGPVNEGTATVPFQLLSFVLQAPPTGAVRVNNTSTVLPVLASNGFQVGDVIDVTGVTDASFNVTNAVVTSIAGGVQYYNPGPDATSGNGTVKGSIVVAISRQYKVAGKNSVTGHIGNASAASPPVIPFSARGALLQPPVFTDPQVDTLVWYSTLDGGGDFFFNHETPLGVIFRDTIPDGFLNTTRQAPLINNLPPVGKYLAVGQSRVFIANLQGASQDIAYSGYEQIFEGRPEESFPLNNRLRLSIGAESVQGIGIIQAGIVAFSATKKMFMLRGNVEDITLNAPVQFSAFLEELPWNVGTMCHQSIRSTAYGLLFWASDRTVQLFDGYAKPVDISGPVFPILRRATPGQEAQASSGYFNWLERDWYGLSFAIDGSATNNYTIFWSLDLDQGSIAIFPCNVQIDFMSAISTSKLQRILAIAQGGRIFNLPVSQDTVGGIGDLVTIPATSGKLSAFWRGGYFGNDSPVRAKMWKRGLLVADQGGFLVNKRLVDNRSHTFKDPKVIGADPVRGDGQFSIGQKAARCSVELIFPSDDVSVNVMELSVGSIATSDRM